MNNSDRALKSALSQIESMSKLSGSELEELRVHKLEVKQDRLCEVVARAEVRRCPRIKEVSAIAPIVTTNEMVYPKRARND